MLGFCMYLWGVVVVLGIHAECIGFIQPIVYKVVQVIEENSTDRQESGHIMVQVH